MPKDDPLNKLSRLVGGASQPPGSFDDEGPAEADEKKLLEDANKVLKYASQIAGKTADIFDVQILIETVADMLRDQIRDEAYSDD